SDSAEEDVEHFVRSLAARHAHLDLIAHPLADERPGQRARDADASLCEIGLVGPENSVRDLFAGVDVGELHGRPEGHAVARELARVDDLGARELVLELLDPSFHERLALARRMVLGVLAEIAGLARRRDRLDDGRALDAPQLVQLFAHAKVPFGRHRDFVHDSPDLARFDRWFHPRSHARSQAPRVGSRRAPARPPRPARLLALLAGEGTSGGLGMGIVGTPESGVRIDVSRPRDGGPPWRYEGEAVTPEARHPVIAVVSADGDWKRKRL